MSYTLRELADHVGGEVAGDGATRIAAITSVALAGPSDLVFASDPEWLEKANGCSAGAILAPKGSASSKPMLLVSDIRGALGSLLSLFEREPALEAGVSSLASVHPSAQVAESAAIGPFASISQGATIGDGVRIHALCYVGDDCRIGPGTIIYPRVVLMPRTVIGARCRLHAGCVIGEAGFGYRFEGGKHVPIAQVGNVVLGDDVEIGANATIDRAMVGATLIGSGTKVDNLVQLAHNVKVGENCIIVAQVGVSGSTELGDFVVLGGQVGVVDHVKIGTGVRVGAQGGATKSIAKPGDYWGTPARPIKETLDTMAASTRLPKALKEIRELRARLEKLEKQLE